MFLLRKEEGRGLGIIELNSWTPSISIYTLWSPTFPVIISGLFRALQYSPNFTFDTMLDSFLVDYPDIYPKIEEDLLKTVPISKGTPPDNINDFYLAKSLLILFRVTWVNTIIFISVSDFYSNISNRTWLKFLVKLRRR